MATESSVVVALREVRRLELERQRREEEALQQMEEARAREEAAARGSIQYDTSLTPYGNGEAWGNGQGQGGDGYHRPMRRTSEVVPLAATNGNGNPFAESQPFATLPPNWEGPVATAASQVKPRSSAKAVFATLVLCAAGAFAGHWKLSNDFNQKLQLVQGDLQRLEESRNEAVAARSKAEQEMKLKVAELEGKLSTANAKASVAGLAVATAMKAVSAAHPAPPVAGAGRAGRGAGSKGRVSGARQGAKPAPAAKIAAPAPAAKVAGPKMAKKKAVSDDPLGGLKL